MRNRFDRQLETLNVEIIKMGALCEEAISSAAKALSDGDSNMIEKVFETDAKIDDMERDIESICMRLLLQQQPVAKDLRTVSSALKMISDMERIGDQAADIAEIIKFISVGEAESKLHIGDMARATIKMVTDSVDSFVKKDIEMAREVMQYDDIVDNLFIKVKNELTELIRKGEQNGEFCLDLLMVAKYFERIGDHATNIADWVCYSLTGEHK
ncbi:MAG: phosphate signaling complex protein PhoU [Acutalibacteraceae bacterium]|nr:phosphate signaling complex protein PhoU [Acutalibacteraceae bacterium]